MQKNAIEEARHIIFFWRMHFTAAYIHEWYQPVDSSDYERFRLFSNGFVQFRSVPSISVSFAQFRSVSSNFGQFRLFSAVSSNFGE